MLGNLLSGVDSRIISKLNIFPDLLGSFHPFGGDKQLSLSLTINALDRSDRTEMVSAPKVLVRSGETAEVQMGKSYFFPTDWDELEVEIEDSDGDNGYSYTLTLPTPSFPDEPELMGTNFKVTPRVLTDGKTIRLDINPVIKSYVGKDEYYMDVLVYRDGKLSEAESQRNLAIWRPIIATRSLDLQVDVYHGETLVLGGLSDSISQSRLDKIPILGDIPFIGRLFQSHSEVSTRRNTLVFVTAKLMDSSGVPIRKTQSNFGIPEMGH
jgi:type II secretory pathway component GspD/PulD (secretin)